MRDITMKKLAVGFRDMFAEHSLQRLVAFSLVPAIAIVLLSLNLMDYINFKTPIHIAISMALIVLIFWQITILLGFLASLLTRLLCKKW